MEQYEACFNVIFKAKNEKEANKLAYKFEKKAEKIGLTFTELNDFPED